MLLAIYCTFIVLWCLEAAFAEMRQAAYAVR